MAERHPFRSASEIDAESIRIATAYQRAELWNRRRFMAALRNDRQWFELCCEAWANAMNEALFSVIPDAH